MEIKYIIALSMLAGSACAEEPKSAKGETSVKVAPENKKVSVADVAVDSAEVAEVAMQIKSEIALFDKARAEISGKLRYEKDREKIQELYKQMPNVSLVASRVLALVRKDPQGAEAVTGLIWVSGVTVAKQKEEATKLLLTDYKGSIELKRYVSELARRYSSSSLERIREVVKVATHPEVQAYAQYKLAYKLNKVNNMMAGESAQEKERRTAEALALLEGLKVSPIVKANSRLYKDVERQLFKVKHLSIGAEAPDIVGVDAAGQAMKLSDYRGKVVLLDFWGHW